MGVAASLCNQSGDRYSWLGIPFSACAVCTQWARSAPAVCTQCNNLAMDTSGHNLKLGWPGVQGHGDVCCVCRHCAQARSTTRHYKRFDFSTSQAWPMTPCTPNRVFYSSKERKKSAIGDNRLASTQQPVASDVEGSQIASKCDNLQKRRNPVRKCHVALKDTMYKEEGSDCDLDHGSSGEELPPVPTKHCKPLFLLKTMVCLSFQAVFCPYY